MGYCGWRTGGTRYAENHRANSIQFFFCSAWSSSEYNLACFSCCHLKNFTRLHITFTCFVFNFTSFQILFNHNVANIISVTRWFEQTPSIRLMTSLQQQNLIRCKWAKCNHWQLIDIHCTVVFATTVLCLELWTRFLLRAWDSGFFPKQPFLIEWASTQSISQV